MAAERRFEGRAEPVARLLLSLLLWGFLPVIGFFNIAALKLTVQIGARGDARPLLRPDRGAALLHRALGDGLRDESRDCGGHLRLDRGLAAAATAYTTATVLVVGVVIALL